jgi:hypothetical protein
MTAELIALIGLGVPTLGYVVRISHQIGALTAGQAGHAAAIKAAQHRLTLIERKIA